ncbi:hypothetical protein BDY21DRAFT_348626 [Lineolata rhizophorae]|uniref:Uncharacterized protein n=1 Tax=Lineolata rhizophorae TaxID=578093 RepID=A0A6A6NVM6_9PEZI|nr:hypothetical protein BDY21DRAFT_348626 [Lineolata rhizophorae]
MDRTPVRVRGRQRRGEGKSEVDQLRASVPEDINDQRNPTQPKLDLAATSRRRAGSKTYRPAKRSKTAYRPLSGLELLPTEILQQIFLESENNDFPATSLPILRKLSSERMYLDFSVAIVLGGRYRKFLPGKKQSPQSRLFASRYMTWQFFQKLLTKMYNDYCLERSKSGLPEDTTSTPPWFHPDQSYRQESEEERPEGSDFEHYKQWFPIDDAFLIPVKLLHGPWEPDKEQFLAWFVRILRSFDLVDRVHTIAGEIATQGLFEAIEQRSCIAADSLMESPIGVIPDPNMIRHAVIRCGCPRDIVGTLVPTAVWEWHYALVTKDPELLVWISRQKESEDAVWLRKLFTEIEDIGNCLEIEHRSLESESDGSSYGDTESDDGYSTSGAPSSDLLDSESSGGVYSDAGSDDNGGSSGAPSSEDDENASE